jgi:glycine cleavage system H protein
MQFPTDLFYTKDHLWVRFEGNIATIGVTAFFADEHSVMSLEPTGLSANVGEVFLSFIDIGGAVFELHYPVTGTDTEYNEDAFSRLIGQWIEDPYGGDWLVKVTLKNPASRAGLLTAAQYKAQIGK